MSDVIRLYVTYRVLAGDQLMIGGFTNASVAVLKRGAVTGYLYFSFFKEPLTTRIFAYTNALRPFCGPVGQTVNNEYQTMFT